MITKESLNEMASLALQELKLNDWTVFSVGQELTNENLPPFGRATTDEVAPVWSIIFLSGDSKPVQVSITDTLGVTDTMVRNQIARRLRDHTSSTA